MMLKIDYFKGRHSLSCVHFITISLPTFVFPPFIFVFILMVSVFWFFPGPVIRAEVGDTIQVVFYNRASKPFSMQPHGVFYEKDYEGTVYNDGELEGLLTM